MNTICQSTGDLYKLGFIPEGAPDPISSGLVEPLSRILKQLSKGGGAKEINIDEVNHNPPPQPPPPTHPPPPGCYSRGTN